MPVRASVLVILLAAIAGTAGLALVMYVQHPTRAPAPPAPSNPFTPPSPGPSAFGWRLIGATSAERMLVLNVETARPRETLGIARQLIEPYKDRYDEVLVLFFEPSPAPRLAFRRVQWTPAQGYRTLELRPLSPEP